MWPSDQWGDDCLLNTWLARLFARSLNNCVVVVAHLLFRRWLVVAAYLTAWVLHYMWINELVHVTIDGIFGANKQGTPLHSIGPLMDFSTSSYGLANTQLLLFTTHSLTRSLARIAQLFSRP